MEGMQTRLEQAQNGNEEAHREVALYVYEKYRTRITQLSRLTLDPACSLEDLLDVFFEEVMKAVLIADGRGDDFYHIGQRGVWTVQTYVRTLGKQMSNRALLVDESADEPDYERIEDRNAEDFREIVHERMASERRYVRIIANTKLKGRSREALELIQQQELDPTVPGFNKALAKAMGVSPQRSSQIMAEIREALT